jgi:hypothetical protein
MMAKQLCVMTLQNRDSQIICNVRKAGLHITAPLLLKMEIAKRLEMPEKQSTLI